MIPRNLILPVLQFTGERDDWRDRAACLEVGGDLFYPYGDEQAASYADLEGALSICERCPVKAACLEQAMQDECGKPLGGRHGIWGGKTAQDRWQMARRSRGSKAC